MVDPYLKIFLITIVPYIELRGGIPYGILKEGLDPLNVFVASTAANIAVIYPSFIFLDWFFHLMEKVPYLKKTIQKTHDKVKPYVDKYGMTGLAVFVAVPLPGTGAYSGALAAHLLGMKNRRAMAAIAAGVVAAGVIVLLVTTVFYETLGWLLG